MSELTKLQLPSKCKPYKDVNPEAITIRPIKGEDEEIIAEITIDNLNVKLNTLLKRVLVGIDPNKLTRGDQSFILNWLAIHSYKKDFIVENVMCQHCLHKTKVSVDLSKLDTIYLPDGYTQPHKITLSTGKDLYLRLLTVADEIEIEKFEKAAIGGKSWVYRYALSIVDQEKDQTQKMKIIRELIGHDMARVRAFQEEFKHGPVREFSFICKECEGTGILPVPFQLEEIFPFGDALKSYFGPQV